MTTDCHSLIEIECIRCGCIEYRRGADLPEGPGAVLGAVGLDLTCASCGHPACIASPPREAVEEA